jgi:predicted DNA-binding transcriptional regulator AlpA
MEASHKTNASHLSVIRGSDATNSGQPCGRLLDAHQVAESIGGVSADWVRRNVPGKISLGHSTKRWYEAELRRWIESRRVDE